MYPGGLDPDGEIDDLLAGWAGPELCQLPPGAPEEEQTVQLRLWSESLPPLFLLQLSGSLSLLGSLGRWTPPVRKTNGNLFLRVSVTAPPSGDACRCGDLGPPFYRPYSPPVFTEESLSPPCEERQDAGGRPIPGTALQHGGGADLTPGLGSWCLSTGSPERAAAIGRQSSEDAHRFLGADQTGQALRGDRSREGRCRPQGTHVSR